MKRSGGVQWGPHIIVLLIILDQVVRCAGRGDRSCSPRAGTVKGMGEPEKQEQGTNMSGSVR